MSITRVPLCRCDFCPAPSDEVWHHCVVCQAPAIEHHHVKARQMGGSKSRKYDKAAIVPLCRQHHEDVTTGGRKDEIVDGWYVVKNKRGNVIVKKEMPNVGSAGVDNYNLNPTMGTGHSWMDFERPVDAGGGRLADDVVSEGALDAEVSPRQANNGVVPSLLQTVADNEAVNGLDNDGTSDDLQASDQRISPISRKEGDYAAWCSRLDRIGSALHSIRGLKSQATWEAGDAALEGERLFGHDSAQDMDRLGLKPKRLANIMWVCERIPEGRRRPSLEWGMHELVAALNVEEQDAWLERAESEGWKRGQLREAIKGPKAEIVYRCPDCGREGKLAEFKEGAAHG